MTTSQTREPTANIVATAVDRLCRLRAPAQREELFQEGMAIALATERRYPDKAQNGAYVYRAVVKSLGNWVSANLAVVHVPRDRCDLARQYQYRDDVAVLEGLPAPDSPEEDLLENEERALLHRWRVDLREYIEDRIFPRLSEQQRELVIRFYGWRGLAPQRPAHIADELGVEATAVYAARERLERILRDDLEFFSFRQQLQELQQR